MRGEKLFNDYISIIHPGMRNETLLPCLEPLTNNCCQRWGTKTRVWRSGLMDAVYAAFLLL